MASLRDQIFDSISRGVAPEFAMTGGTITKQNYYDIVVYAKKSGVNITFGLDQKLRSRILG